jgi:signal transduction histidine kinase/ligand-binding sensor domain-containing protein
MRFLANLAASFGRAWDLTGWGTVTVWALLLLLFPAAESRADHFPVFRQISMPEGLPDAHVEAIVQDRFGYVWIGTRAGLIRHEGDQLSLMPRRPSQPNALPAQNIMALHAHSDGMVWASLEGHGLVEIGPDLTILRRLEPQAQGGPLFDNNVWSMVEDCQGRLWMAFAQGGVAVFDPQTDRVQHFDQSEEFGLNRFGFQTHLMLDGSCRIWLVQTLRVSVIDPSGDMRKFEPVLESSMDGRRDVFINGWVSEEGTVYVGYGNELIRLTVHEGPLETTRADVVHTSQTLITGIGAWPDGRMFLTTRGGLAVLDRRTGESYLIEPRPALPYSLPSPALYGAHLVDAEGGLWLSVDREGLVYLAPNHSAFTRLPDPELEQAVVGEHIAAISPGRDRLSFWVDSEPDSFRLNVETGERTSISDIFPALSGETSIIDSTIALLETDAGLLLLTIRSLLILRSDSGLLETLISSDEVMPRQMMELHPAGETGIWISMRGGELRYMNLETGLVQQYGPQEAPPYHLPESGLLSLAYDTQDQLWLAGESAVYRHQGDEGFVQWARIDVGPIRTLTWDEDTLWVGTDLELYRYRRIQNTLLLTDRYDISALTERDTLLNIVSVPTNDETIWLILRSGVASLNLTSGHFKSFSRADGLALTEFSPGATTVLDDGRILLGGTKGLVTIDPQRLREDPMDPPVYLRAVSAGDRRIPLTPGPRSSLDLDWDENSVRFEFSALTYVAPERVQYRVRLSDWDDDWLELGRQSSLYYSNLRPGQYRFDVQAAGPDGRWGDSGDQLTISIAPPPWRSSGAWVAYATLVILVLAVSWAQFNQSRMRRREFQGIQQKRKLAEAQRQLIQRLNRDLNPLSLARAVAEEIQRLSGASSVIFGFLHELMPDELVIVDASAEWSREEWWQRLEHCDGLNEQAVDLQADDEVIARVLLIAGSEGFNSDYGRPLGLLVDVAVQALQNSALLQQVRLLADQAEQASRAKTEFLATMSHEIRTPLHGLLGMAELLKDGDGRRPPRDLLNTLTASGQQLQRIIDDVLDISKIEAGRMQLLAEPFETMPLLEQLIDLHASSAARKRLDLRLRVSTGFPLVATGDAGRLAQILGNLVNNAIKFTPSGSVELGAEVARDGELCFSVRDTGPGIPPDQVTRLFQPFSQLDSTVTREHSGSGLGLAISRRLAEGMNGKLQLRRSSSSGSVFELRLPAVGTACPPRLTGLLSELELVALVSAPTYRLLLRTARRWGFQLTHANTTSPQAGAVVLFDERDPRLATAAMRWHDLGCPLIAISTGMVDNVNPGNDQVTAVRWPLNESRLVAALLDQVV